MHQGSSTPHSTGHIRQTGRVFSARAVQVLLVLGVGWNAYTYSAIAPTLVEMAAIATRTESYTDYSITVLENGGEILVDGAMAFGLGEELAEVLARNPDVYLLHLNSSGGRLAPARQVRDLVTTVELRTYVPGECSSACLVAFMAGNVRILHTDARLGFHAYRFPGLTQDQIEQEIDSDKEYFRSKGVEPAFLERAFSSPPETLWHPTLEELIANGIVTHTYDGQTLEATDGNIDVFQIQPGDCFNDMFSGNETSGDGTIEVANVSATPCLEPHDDEAYAAFDLDLAAFPGLDEMGALAESACLERFEAFVGKNYEASLLDIHLLFPTRETWTQRGDREVVCAVYNLGGQKLVGSMEGSGM